MPELKHFGIKGQKWGVRRFQNPDGTRTAAGRRKKREYDAGLSKKDQRWVKRKSDKITQKTEKAVKKDLVKYAQELMKNPDATRSDGKLSSKTITAYNNRMAELMNNKISGMTAPSGKSIAFVAKRGETGVFMAVYDQGYNMDRIKNGIYSSGKVAYKGDIIDTVERG